MQRLVPDRYVLELTDGLSVFLVGRRNVFGPIVSDRTLVRRADEIEAELRRFAQDAVALAKLRRFHLLRTRHQWDRYADDELVRVLARSIEAMGYAGLSLLRVPPGLTRTEQAIDFLSEMAPAPDRSTGAPRQRLPLGNRPVAVPTAVSGPAPLRLAFAVSPPVLASIGDDVGDTADVLPAELSDRFIEVLKRVPDHLKGEMKDQFFALTGYGILHFDLGLIQTFTVRLRQRLNAGARHSGILVMESG